MMRPSRIAQGTTHALNESLHQFKDFTKEAHKFEDAQ